MSTGEASIVVKATPEAAYALLSDPTRTPEYSPECVKVEWEIPGRMFRGHNKDGDREWAMQCVVDQAEPNRAFAFHTQRDGKSRARWGYRISGPDEGPTRIIEWYERVGKVSPVARVAERLLMGGREKHNAENMKASLARIKAILEG